MLLESFKALTIWLHAHPEWGAVIAFFVAFTESLAIIGAIIPGSVTLTAIGVLVGSAVIPATPTIIAAIVGAIAGDVLSFFLGKFFQQQLHHTWPFARYPHWLDKGERFFHRYGGKSIFFGRFVGPVRSILPLAAGVLRMPTWQFIIADVISAILWAPAYILPGIILGAATLELEPQAAVKLIAIVLILILVICIVAWLLRTLLKWKIDYINRSLNRLYQKIRQHHCLIPLANFLADPNEPEGYAQLARVFIALFALGCLGILTFSVITQGSLTAFNQPFYHLLQSFRTTLFENIAVVLTIMGGKYVMLPMLVLLTLIFYKTVNRWTALHFFVNGFMAAGIAFIMKIMIAHPRPETIIAFKSTYSFPSGHGVLTCSIIGGFAYFLVQHIEKSLRHYITWPSALLISAVLFSRLYLGAHWLTDVLASISLSVFCLMFTALFYHRQSIGQAKLFPLLLTSLICLASLTLLNVVQHAATTKAIYSQKPRAHVLSIKTWWTQTTPLLPTHIYNRLGHQSLALNIQWAGSLKALKQNLKDNGWSEIPKTTLVMRINRIAGNNKHHRLPIFGVLYRFQEPSFVFKKITDQHMPLLILRLWPSGITFTDDKRELWIGMIHYRVMWHHQWITAKLRQYLNSPPAISYIQPLLPKQVQWKKIKLNTITVILVKAEEI